MLCNYSAVVDAQRAVPTVITMGGGYSWPIDATVSAHADVYRAAARLVAAQM